MFQPHLVDVEQPGVAGAYTPQLANGAWTSNRLITVLTVSILLFLLD